MAETIRRNRLLPWYIGIAIVILVESYVGYEYRDIDSFQFNGLIAGIRVWF